MMLYLQSGAGQGKIRAFLERQGVREGLTAAGYGLTGLVMAAASLGHRPQPLVLGLILAAAKGWPLLSLGLGGAAGYLLFWGRAGMPGLAWIALGMLTSAVTGILPRRQAHAGLFPLLAGLIVAAVGVAFALWGGEILPFPGYLLQIFLAAGSTWIYTAVLDHRDPVRDWLALGLGVLALAQVAPGSWFCFGFFAAGAMGAAGPFPLAALAGLALDLAQVTRVPMTAVLCGSALVRMLSGSRVWNHRLAPGLVYLPVAALCGVWDLHPLPGLAIGGLLTGLLPGMLPSRYRRGAAGLLQVRLELAAGVLDQSRRLILQGEPASADRQALISAAVGRSCGGCPCRKGCREREKAEQLPQTLLDSSLVTAQDLPFSCRRTGRLWAQLNRAQEQYRILLADHRRRLEYRQAVGEQYEFLARYLRDLSDSLGTREQALHLRYEPVTSARTCSREAENGDRCEWFAGAGGKYYVLLCDGMGTGAPACREAKQAAWMLKDLLKAGYPGEYALKSLNNLCILRGFPGAVSVDLAELNLETGRAELYKWGAPASYLVSGDQIQKIGTAVPPPGLSVTEGRGSLERLSLRRGERLVLLSDGAGGEAALNRVGKPEELSPEALAEQLLEYGKEAGTDDATAAVVCLRPAATATR